MIGHVQVVKKAGAKLQMRVVQPALVEHWSQRARSLARDISRINEVSLFLQQPTAVHTSHRDRLADACMLMRGRGQLLQT